MSRTFQNSYREHLKRLAGLEPASLADALGARYDGSALQVGFYDQTFRVAKGKIADAHGRPPTDAVGLVLCQYLIRCPDPEPPAGQLVTFRELDGAGPLVSNFAGNTNKLVAATFGTQAGALEANARQMGGEAVADAGGFDLFMQFRALPKVPIYIQFNAADDLFPAQCTLLFRQSAQHYLDMQSLFILGTYLAGRLIRTTDG